MNHQQNTDIEATREMYLVRIRVAANLTVDNVRAEYGDAVADFVESSLEEHLRAALAPPRRANRAEGDAR